MNYLNEQLWNYAESEGLLPKLDGCGRTNREPPVFQRQYADQNILLPPDADDETRSKVVCGVSRRKRHSKFCSMKSSQALAQSVFANLVASGDLHVLNDLVADRGLPAFGVDLGGAKVQLEYAVGHLGEPTQSRTSIDVFISGERRIAVECKLTETEFGKCSRVPEHCSGNYERQRGRKERCYLSERDILYWKYAPDFFIWENGRDISPCPLRFTYQIARNLLAAGVLENGAVAADSSHALIIYDERNPEFGGGGKCRGQFDAACNALKIPSMLRLCSWQSVTGELAKNASTKWLAAQLQNKYGF